MQKFTVKLKPSWLYAVILCALHAFVLIIVVLMLPGWCQCILIPIILVSLIYYVAHDALRCLPWSIISFGFDLRAQQWWIQTASGKKITASEGFSGVGLTSLVALTMKTGRFKRYRLVVSRKMISSAEFSMVNRLLTLTA